jgi:3-oxoacyl-[acyl-carrier-protein] synthase-3
VILSNDDLRASFPDADIVRLASKTGITSRRVAGPDQSAADLATSACRHLLDRHPKIDIDALVYVTQSPEYLLPSTSCLIQDRLGLPKSTACFDLNLGCSGYVYGLAVVSGLVAAGIATRVLLVTSDTLTKYLAPSNIQTRILFGDAASATLITAGDESIGPFQLYTDGGGGPLLRCPPRPILSRSEGAHAEREEPLGSLLMDGAGIFTFTLREVPSSVDSFMKSRNRTFSDYDHVVFHQANAFVIDQLSSRLAIPAEKVVRNYQHIGNTTSSSIPAAMHWRRQQDSNGTKQARWLLIGFGVGLSWGVGEVVF